MDTNRFQHDKSSTVTVTFDQPQYAVVTIPVKVYIRTDVVLTPGSINFGAVDHGTGQERKIELTYAGDPNWSITKVITNNEYLKAQAKQTARKRAGRLRPDRRSFARAARRLSPAAAHAPDKRPGRTEFPSSSRRGSRPT